MSKKLLCVNKIKEYDLGGYTKHQIEHNQNTFLNMYGGKVAEELLKCKIKIQLIERPHKFTNGEGYVAQRLVIKIDFSEIALQAHNDFESDFGHAVAMAIEQNINGDFENASDESEPEE
jgi:hypothetical protein